MENARKHSNIKLVPTERRRNYLILEPNYHTTNFFTEYLLAIDMKKNLIIMNKPAGLPILGLSEISLYMFW